ncbi:MAG: type II secretion system protein GspK [Phycisphaerales bacterium]|nr:type II secretion system protein GspK [Phycisphaerales bacterium]
MIRISNFEFRHSRGSAFIATTWIIAALTGLTLVLAHTVRVETLASANRLAQAQADAAARGAEQFVLAAVDAEIEEPGSVTSLISGINMEALTIGDERGGAYVWIIRPDPDDETEFSFGLADEAAKLDLNHATTAQLQMLPNMTTQNADCIFDWRNTDSTQSPEGAKDSTYLAADDGRPPYRCKSAPFETVEELLLVYSVTPELLWGEDLTRSGHVDQADTSILAITPGGGGTTTSNRGIFPFVTVYGTKASTAPQSNTEEESNSSGGSNNSNVVNVNDTNTANLETLLNEQLGTRAPEILRITQERISGSTAMPFSNIWEWAVTVNITAADFSLIFSRVTVVTPQGFGFSMNVPQGSFSSDSPSPKINVNSASQTVLMTIPSFEQTDADAIISYRQNNPDPDDPSNIAWLLDVIPKPKLETAGYFITGISYCYSADILTCSRDGRAFNRTRIVVDASGGFAKIIYRRDMTAFGWPLDPQIREDIRAGKPFQTTNGLNIMQDDGFGGMW